MRVPRQPTAFWSCLTGALEKRQRQLATYLERKTAYWDQGSKLMALVAFCLVFGGLSLWLLMKAISHF
ncbi:hypothetical protein KXD93_22580 [Mucilaginibacter sp. BJC16-A38]|uniref:hypothetical protein n=1 Tax=Mucilaginibacter phenanthrenivorans TaxID=1234842 RepID=UPI0021581D6D|nr:hypothetical protein [Mucilaginibacter phenanthrenivorans]MCR8560458.1 hypothetical protein [Mucilaginibacter phenanthrenivorans]